MSYTLGEAAKATGKSKTDIARKIKRGIISAAKNEDGSYSIDPAELHRVLPSVSDRDSDPEMVQSETPRLQGLLEREIVLLRENLAGKDEVIDDLRRRLDQSEQERRDKDRQLTAVLADQTRPKPRRWMLPAVIGVAVLAVLLLVIALWHPMRSALP